MSYGCGQPTSPTAHLLSQLAKNHLGHLCWAHAGERVLQSVHHHVNDQLPLHKPPFFQCLTCVLANGDHQATCNHPPNQIPPYISDWIESAVSDNDANCLPGQKFHVDSALDHLLTHHQFH